MYRKKGFTLAELLIALGILGVISTFTIPKVLVSQQNKKYSSAAKEVAAMIAESFVRHQQAGLLTASTKPSDLRQYMNYVKLDTSGAAIDTHPAWTGYNGDGTSPCNSTYPCIRLHSGGVLMFDDPKTFGSATNLHAVGFAYDPDGVATGGTADAPGKAVQFELYYNGFITTRGQTKPGSCFNMGCGFLEPDPAFNPSWFSW